MSYLLDTNIFLRLARRNDPQRQIALEALRLLRSRNEKLCYTSQVVAEFWNVCTRSTSVRGGLGLSIVQTERKVRLIERHFRLLTDSPAIHWEWRTLLSDHAVRGVAVYDARFVAIMKVYGISRLLTFNGDDFKRYQDLITVVSPEDVTSGV